MKWVLTNEPASAILVFNLVENNIVQQVLRYHTVQQSARLLRAGSQRVYFVEQSRFRNNYFVFKNEYGLETGRIHADSLQGDSGTLEAVNVKIQFSLHHKQGTDFILYDNDGLKPKIMCGWQHAFPPTQTNTFGKLEACLLWGLYWHLSVTEEKVPVPGKNTALA